MKEFATALACFQRGDLAGAEKALGSLLAKAPSNADALHLAASVRHARGDLPGALALFDQAAAAAPKDAAIAFNRAAILASLGRHAEAVDGFDRVLALTPKDAETLLLRGVSQAALARYEDALASYDAALAAGLTRSEVHANRGAALASLSRHEEAVAASDQALALTSNDAAALFNRGASLEALGRASEAIDSLTRAIAIDPTHALAHAVRSTALANLGRFDEALSDIDFAIERQPERIDYWDRRGHALITANRVTDAIAAYDRLLAANPNDGDAVYAKGAAYLFDGDFKRGFELYEARWTMRDGQPPMPGSAPVWLGREPLTGKRIVVQTEQGFGDLFQFCRFIPALAERGATVIVQERPQTLTLLKTLAGVDSLISSREPQPPADFRIPLASLMLALDVQLEDLPGPIPYLAAEPERVAAWREKLGPLKRRIGVCWSGGGGKRQHMSRRLDDEALDLLLSADVELISLQMDAGAEASILKAHGVREFGRDTAEFADLAALIETLDLVITIDTGVAHLAGALGKPVWILLPYHPDWRWLQDREDTPWYPTARLFRQKVFGEWRGAVEAVLAAL